MAHFRQLPGTLHFKSRARDSRLHNIPLTHVTAHLIRYAASRSTRRAFARIKPTRSRYAPMSPAESSSRATPLTLDHGNAHLSEDTPGVESDDARHQTDDESAAESEPSKRKQKRARKLKAPQAAPRKKYVRGKQGALKGIMKMPIEVFTEIACHITPADLITLVRTNKFFRSMLLRRSAILVWHRAQDNVPGLPPCPTGMNEPQYAALLFFKHCTLCGKTATSKPDPWIRARLCSECRDTKLGQATMHIMEYQLVAVTWHIKPQKGRRRNQAARFLLEEFEQTEQTRQEFLDKKDHEGLREWENQTLARLETQRSEAEELIKYIGSVELSREQEIEILKSVRQDEVYERLEALGWERRYFNFGWSPDARRWETLVRVPKPLTDKMWENLSPKLTPLLEDNKCRIDEQDRQSRKAERTGKITQLVQRLRENMYPFHDICQSLDLQLPSYQSSYMDARVSLANFFPAVSTIASWDILADIRDGENSLEAVEELFNGVREELVQKVLEWREQAERKLVEQYMPQVDDSKGMNSALTIKGKTDATESLSPFTRFLLRADTIFLSAYYANTEDAQDKEHGSLVRGEHFPNIISGVVGTDVSHLKRYVCHAGAERIVKALLKDLGMQDVAYVEVIRADKVFACLRCGDLPSASWEDLLSHYQNRVRQWSGGNFIRNKYVTRHPVPFFHVHCLESGPNAKPLACMLSREEAKKDSQRPWSGSRFWCLICSGVGGYSSAEFTLKEPLARHMDDVHGITEDLVRDLHYTESPSTAWSQSSRITAWQERWDAHCDAKAEDNSTDDPGHELSSESETSSEPA